MKRKKKVYKDAYIYLFRDLKTKKVVYIGKHNGKKKKYFTSGEILNRKLNKYGRKEFDKLYAREIIEIGNFTNDEMNNLEIKWIKLHRTFYNYKEGGFNLTKGGEGASGFNQSQEQKDHISHVLTGYKHTEKSRKNMSKGQQGVVHTPEHNARIGDGVRGEKNGNYGKTFSKKTKKKQSKAAKERWKNMTQEELLVMSNRRKGKDPWNKGIKGAQKAWNKIKISKVKGEQVLKYYMSNCYELKKTATDSNLPINVVKRFLIEQGKFLTIHERRAMGVDIIIRNKIKISKVQGQKIIRVYKSNQYELKKTVLDLGLGINLVKTIF